LTSASNFSHPVLIFVLSLPAILGFNLLSGFQPFGDGSSVMDLEDFLVSYNILTRFTSSDFFRVQLPSSTVMVMMFSNTAMTVERAAKDMTRRAAAPDAAAHHVLEHVRQGDEQQGRTGIRLYAIGKARRNDDQTSHNGNEGVQNYHVDRFAGDTPTLFQIAAEELHCTPAPAQGQARV